MTILIPRWYYVVDLVNNDVMLISKLHRKPYIHMHIYFLWYAQKNNTNTYALKPCNHVAFYVQLQFIINKFL